MVSAQDRGNKRHLQTHVLKCHKSGVYPSARTIKTSGTGECKNASSVPDVSASGVQGAVFSAALMNCFPLDVGVADPRLFLNGSCAVT